ncbi:SH3 domain-containing protein [Agathobaculum sp. Marseille-P7918]|uniref:SH3 domain-containing protein n=1 Tax=Agathobaculum sp. Marseille-P7918 TaxID=2479843 RepID=UPI000F63CC38|nr:SH3 domain-containing protein [Agathobaculum sp. Marseille-P7918]
MRYHRVLTYDRSLQHSGRPIHGRTATAESFSGDVSIYASPSSQAEVIGTAPCGACLQVLGRRADWHAIRYGQYLGYVPGDKIVLNY